MDYIDYRDIKKELSHSNLIGVGTTAYCYKLDNGTVVKIYKKMNVNKYALTKELFSSDLERFHDVSNDTFVSMDKIVLNNYDIAGYTYPYAEGRSLKEYSNKIRLNKVFRNYQKVLTDTKDISAKGFRLFDIHSGNIIISCSGLKVIDLDKCEFRENTYPKINISINSSELFDNIFGHIYRKKTFETLIFLDEDIQYLYNNLDKTDYQAVINFLNYLKEYIQNDNPTLEDVKKKVKVKKIINDYR